MRIVEFLDFALQNGCGKTLTHLCSSRGEFLTKKKEGMLSYDPMSDQGVALRIGPLAFGSLLRKYPEKVALAKARELINKGEEKYTQFADFLALVYLLGEELVEAASETLPADIKKLAGLWKDGTVEDQLGIIKQVFTLWRSEYQTEIDVLHDLEGLHQFFEKTNEHTDISRYLPKQFGDPNCLGRELQLVAFAKMCGACFYSALVICHLADGDRQMSLRIITEIRSDARNRGLELDSSLAGSLASYECAYQYLLEAEKRFHGCILMQLTDGNWAALDPYGVVWGILPQGMQKQMQETDRILLKYKEVLPGLSLPLVEQDGAKRYEEYLQTAKGFIQRSKEVEAILRDAKDLDTFVQLVLEHVVMDDLLEGSTFAAVRERAKSDPAFKSELVWGIIGAFQEREGILGTEQLLAKAVESVLTYYYLLAMESLAAFDTDRQNGLLVHPALEVMASPILSVGASVLNSVAVGQFETFELAEFLAQTLYSQLFLRNVLVSLVEDTMKKFPSRLEFTPFTSYCLDCLKGIPIRHPIVEETFQMLDQISGLA